MSMDTLHDCPNLKLLFEHSDRHVDSKKATPLPAPERRSSLAADQVALKHYWIMSLINRSFGAGVAQVYTLRRTVVELRFIDPYTPYSLLRSALESFAQTVWLLGGSTRKERQIRTLQAWAFDYKERQNYETAVGHVVVPPAKSGSDRRTEVIAHAKSLGLPADQVGGDLYISKMIRQAVDSMGQSGDEAVAAWRMASAFAHGKLWPTLRSSEVTGAALIEDGAWVSIVIDDAKIDEVAMWCDRLLEQTVILFNARARR